MWEEKHLSSAPYYHNIHLSAVLTFLAQHIWSWKESVAWEQLTSYCSIGLHIEQWNKNTGAKALRYFFPGLDSLKNEWINHRIVEWNDASIVPSGSARKLLTTTVLKWKLQWLSTSSSSRQFQKQFVSLVIKKMLALHPTENVRHVCVEFLVLWI